MPLSVGLVVALRVPDCVSDAVTEAVPDGVNEVLGDPETLEVPELVREVVCDGL